MLDSLRLETHSPDDTQRVGDCLGRCASEGDVFLLTGNLGAGKTCLTQGIARGLEVEAYTRSPSFVIATQYAGRLTLHHIDLYRLEDPMEIWDLGLDETLGVHGVGVVEWADRASDQMPVEALWIAMDYGSGEQKRTIVLKTISRRYQQHLTALQARFSQGKA